MWVARKPIVGRDRIIRPETGVQGQHLEQRPPRLSHALAAGLRPHQDRRTGG
jgi:hypothetical protein